MNHDPLVIERTYHAHVSKVWKAITDKNEMKRWYFDLTAFQADVGFEFEFLAGTEEKKYRHRCAITEVLTEKKLAYSWRYEGYEGLSHVTFELFAEGEQTRLRLTHAGLGSFPAIPDFAEDRFSEGWAYLTGTALKDFLESPRP